MKRPQRLSTGNSRELADTQVLRVLSDWQPLSAQDIAGELGIALPTVHKRLGRMHKRRLIHIADWARRIGTPAPLVAIGRAPDAPPPEPLTDLERVMAYQARRKQDPKRHAAFLKARRIYKARRRKTDPEYDIKVRLAHLRHARKKKGCQPRIHKDPILAALMGIKRHDR